MICTLVAFGSENSVCKYILYLGEDNSRFHGKYADKIKMPQFTNVLLFEDCNSVVKGG